MDFKFPDVGEGLTEGTLLKWLVKVGESVKLDQPIAQVETDKAVVDIPAPVAGVIAELIGKEGETLTVGEVMARFNTDGASVVVPKKDTAQPIVAEVIEKPVQKKAVATAQVLATPAVRRYAHENNINLASVSGSGNHGQILLSDLDGATKSDSVAKPITASNSKPVVETPIQSQSTFVPLGANTQTNILATPSVRRQARELEIDIKTVRGSGSNGRILADDLRKTTVASDPVSLSGPIVPKPVPIPSQATAKDIGGDSTRVPLSKTRQVIAKRMVESLQHTASVTTSDEVDVTDLYALYEVEKVKLKEQNIRLSFLAFITKIVTLALKKYPVFNSTLDESTNELIMHNNMHIGLAVATPNGLLVPVISKAQDKSITELAESISSLAKKARDGKLTLPQMSGSTFTISNIGSIGGAIFTPIINYPEVAILGVGRTVDKPAVLNGEIAIRKMLWLSLTFDHRVGDGAEAAFFLNTIKEYLEDEKSLLVDLT